MSEYLIFFNDAWVTQTDDDGWQQRARRVRVVVDAMKTAGVYIFTGGLDTTAPVVHVRPEDGQPVFADGPYDPSNAVLGGFVAIDVPDAEAAQQWAGRIAVACGWPQEIRVFRRAADVSSPEAGSAR